MKVHVFNINGEYILVDGRGIEVYHLPDSIGRQLERGEIDLNSLEKQINVKSKDIEIENKFSENLCSRLTINLTSRCNMACKYCYAHYGDYQQQVDDSISLDIIRNTTQLALDLYPEGIRFVQFFGGEPLLVKGILQSAMEIIREICRERGIQEPYFGMVTNGTLIDDKTAKFMVKNLTTVTISLDGNQEVNDYNRCLANNSEESVYQKVKEAVVKLHELKPDFRVACAATVTKKNIDDYIAHNQEDTLYDSIYNDIGFDACACNPVFDCGNPDMALENTKIDKVKNYFDSFRKRQLSDDRNETSNLQALKRVLDLLFKKEYGELCGALTTDLAVDVIGGIYPCFMFIGEEKFLIADAKKYDLVTVKNRNAEIRGIMNRANDNAVCSACWAEKMCVTTYGKCIGARYLKHQDIKQPISLTCEIGKEQLECSIWEAIRNQEARCKRG